MKKVLRKNPGSGKEKRKKLRELKKYRKVQVALAISRDNATCVNCYWFPGRVRPYEHVHHTEGRGTYEKERYTKLICLCSSCHNVFSAMRQPSKPIHINQRGLVKLANHRPINQEFEHNFYEQD